MFDFKRIEELKEIFRANYSSIEQIDQVISHLKKKGASQLETAWVLKAEMNLPLIDIDKMVLNSPAWKNEKPLNEFIREAFFDSE